MTLDEFVAIFADLLEDTDPSEIGPDTYFQELDEWSSLLNLGVIAMVKTNLGKDITAKEIRSCETIQDLYNHLQ
jgi:acyl carrier protein